MPKRSTRSKKPAPTKRVKPAAKAERRKSSSPKTKTMDLQSKITHFGSLAMEIRGKPEFQRISLFVQEKVGKRLQEYLTGPAPESDKHALIDELTEIVEKKQWDKLPAAPSGQTEAAPAPAEKPAAAPAPAAKAKPAPAAAAPAASDDVVEEDPDVAIAEAEKKLAEARAAAAAKKAAGTGLTKEQVLELIKAEVPGLVKAELKAVLQGLADAL